MILGKLVGLYDRLVASGELAAPWLMSKGIHLAVVIDRNGHPLEIDTLFREEDKKIYPQAFQVPLPPKGRSGSRPPACLLYDRIDYTLGVPMDKTVLERGAEEALEKAQAAQQRFAEAIAKLPQGVQDDAGVAAVVRFLADPELSGLLGHTGLKKVAAMDGALVSFRMDGDTHQDGKPRLVVERPAVQEFCRVEFEGAASDAMKTAVCSITGALAPVARLHSKIRKISKPDGSLAEATLVSFNASAFESYGQDGGANSAISVMAERAYTSALNHLTSTTRKRIGGVTYVAWSEGGIPDVLDDSLAALFGEDIAENSLNTADPETVLGILRGVDTGLLPADDGGTYNVLGLQAAMARAVVRYWRTGIQAEIGDKIAFHFEDFGFGLHRRRVLPVWSILSCIALNDDVSRLPPAMAANIIRAAFDGTAYPRQLQWAATERFIRSKSNAGGFEPQQNDRRIRCLIACLRRAARLGHISEDIPMALDKENTNPAYLLGRLFATYEAIQRSADPTLNVTLRDQMFGAAARTPSRAFAVISIRSGHHMAKLRKTKPGLAVFYSKRTDEIMSLVSPEGLPERLVPDDVARFAVGYHHERSDRKVKEQETAAGGVPAEEASTEVAETGGGVEEDMAAVAV